MFNSSFTTADRIIKSKIVLNKSHPFFSYILMNMEIEQSESVDFVPTMGVNEYGNLYWNKEFVDTLNEEELNGVLAHESMHMATLTHARRGTKDPMIWNIATDVVINYLITEEGFKLPKDVLLPVKGVFTFEGKNGKVSIDVTNKSAEDVYDFLLNHINIIKLNLAGGGPQSGGSGQYKGQIDVHIEGDKNSKGESTNKDKGEASKKANAEKWKKKAVEAGTAARMRGTLSAALERALDGILEPEIDWRSKLYAFITKELPVDYSMRMPGRRFYTTGVYYPSVIRENIEIICGCDNSGSISYGSKDSEGAQFIGEAVGIADSFPQIKMRFIWWSTYVHKDDDIEVTKQTIDNLVTHKPCGGGGTHMSCFNEYIKKKGYSSRIYVILTDGYIEGNPQVPNDGICLFVLSRGGSDEIIKKFGEVCKLGRGQNK